jgi:predicted GNAT family acetyltransferase
MKRRRRHDGESLTSNLTKSSSAIGGSGRPDLSNTDSVLDNAIWFSLTTRHSNIAEGKGRVRRYPVGVSPLGAIEDASDASLEALASLLRPDEEIALGSPTEIVPVGGLEAFARMTLRQMVRSSVSRPITAQHVIPLGAADVADMLALVEITKPGPFRRRTHELGQYFGIRVEGRLVAMAGERLRPVGYTEISAVCTHPDYRGRGYGRDLVETLVRNIIDRGEVPILHVEKDNRAASLYEQLGFSTRQTIHLVALRKPNSIAS